ncbi:PEP-CTERM sorting domain-containing protein [Scytonema sp. NUACC21]
MSSFATAATIYLQDNFDTEGTGIPQLNYGNFANWNVVNGSVDLIGKGLSSTSFDFLPSNGLYVDMDGSTYKAGKLESKTTFIFNPGEIINLSFKLAGTQRIDNKNNSVIVSLGSLFTETFSLPASQGFQSFTRNVTITSASNGKLVFEGTGNDNIGMLLDDVKLSVTSPNTTLVPEPGSMLGLLTVGAFGMTSLLKYRQRHK